MYMPLFAERQEGLAWQPCNKQWTLAPISWNWVSQRISTDKHQLCQIWGPSSHWAARGDMKGQRLSAGHWPLLPNVFVELGYNTLASDMVRFLIYRVLRNSTGSANMLGGLGVSRNTLWRMTARLAASYSKRATIRRNTNLVGFNVVTSCRVTDSYEAFECTWSLHRQCNNMGPTYQNIWRHFQKTIIFIFPGVRTTNLRMT